MHNLGHTRGTQQSNHLLLTPDTFVCAPLPGMKKCTAIIHVGPAVGAAFTTRCTWAVLMSWQVNAPMTGAAYSSHSRR